MLTAMARPIPRPVPVTTAIFPANSCFFASWVLQTLYSGASYLASPLPLRYDGGSVKTRHSQGEMNKNVAERRPHRQYDDFFAKVSPVSLETTTLGLRALEDQRQCWLSLPARGASAKG